MPTRSSTCSSDAELLGIPFPLIPRFVAPEVVNCKETHVHYEPVCDVFSMGLIFYILLTGKPAFPGKSYNDVLVKNRKCEIILNGTLFDNIPSTCTTFSITSKPVTC
jgi:serine/threonine protein kinase